MSRTSADRCGEARLPKDCAQHCTPGKTLYDILGVGRTATDIELRSAYRRRALQAHPDKGGTNDEFQAVVRAFEILSSTRRRTVYDSQLFDDGDKPEPRPEAKKPEANKPSRKKRNLGTVAAHHEATIERYMRRLRFLVEDLPKDERRISIEAMPVIVRAGLISYMERSASEATAPASAAAAAGAGASRAGASCASRSDSESEGSDPLALEDGDEAARFMSTEFYSTRESRSSKRGFRAQYGQSTLKNIYRSKRGEYSLRMLFAEVLFQAKNIPTLEAALELYATLVTTKEIIMNRKHPAHTTCVRSALLYASRENKVDLSTTALQYCVVMSVKRWVATKFVYTPTNADLQHTLQLRAELRMAFAAGWTAFRRVWMGHMQECSKRSRKVPYTEEETAEIIDGFYEQAHDVRLQQVQYWVEKIAAKLEWKATREGALREKEQQARDRVKEKEWVRWMMDEGRTMGEILKGRSAP